MALRRHMTDQPAGTWGFMALGTIKYSNAPQVSGTSRPQDEHPTLASQNPSGIGSKRPAGNDQVDKSAAAPESPPKKIKLEDVSEDWTGTSKYGGFFDLTGDSSDDESARKPEMKKTLKNTILTASTRSAAKVAPGTREPSSADEDKMTSVIRTPAPSSPGKATPQPSSFSRSSTDDGTKYCIAETSKAPLKQVVTTNAFNSDDDTESETEKEPTTRQPVFMDQRASPTAQRMHVQDEKLAEQKLAERKHAAELRLRAEEKKLARRVEEAWNAAQKPPPQSDTQRLVSHSESESMAGQSHTTSRPTKKGSKPSTYTTGRRVEPGKLSSTHATNSALSPGGRSEKQKAREYSRNGTIPAEMTARAALTSSATMNPTRPVERSQNSNSHPTSKLQSTINKKDSRSIVAPSKLSRPISPPPTQKRTKSVTIAHDPPLGQQPSTAANLARSHFEQLRAGRPFLAASPKSGDQVGLSQAPNAKLFGEDSSGMEEVAIAAVVNSKHVIDLAAQEHPMECAVKKDEAYKALLANQLSQAQRDEARAAERRRLIDLRKEEKERLALEVAAQQKREFDEHSRVVMKQRMDRLSEENRHAEEMRVKEARLQESIKRRNADEQVKLKNLEARKAQIPELSEQREREKQERIRKKQQANMRKHAAEVEAQVEIEAALLQDEDSGELILEGESDSTRILQASQDVLAAHPGQGSPIQTGPFSLNTAKGTTSIIENIVQGNLCMPTSIEQRIVQEKRGWASQKNRAAKESVVNTPIQRTQEASGAFFASHSARNVSRDQSLPRSPPKTPTAPTARTGHTRKLGSVTAEDAKLVKWRDLEDMSWDQIAAAFFDLTRTKRAANTLAKRYRLVKAALEKAQVGFTLQQKLAAGDSSAQDEVNSMIEAANAAPEREDGSSHPPLLGSGPIKLPVQNRSNVSSSLWQNPRCEMEEEIEDVEIVHTRSALQMLEVPEVRPTTSGKCMAAVHQMIGRQHCEARGQDYDAEVEEVYSETQDQELLLKGFTAEDLQPYGFQVQRRELSAEDAEMGFPIENEEWTPCGDIYRNCGEANGAAMAEVITIMPGGAFYANPADAPCLQYLETKTDRLQRFVFCQLVNPVHGTVQTTVDRVLLAPRVRMVPPTPEDIQEELRARQVWFIIQQITIEPPSRRLNPLFKAPRIEIVGDRDPYTDYNLATKRAVQAFVEKTYKSDLQSLDSRSEEKRERVEGHVAGILADKSFQGEMEIVNGMEGMADIMQKYKVEEGSKITLGIWLEQGGLRGPRN